MLNTAMMTRPLACRQNLSADLRSFHASETLVTTGGGHSQMIAGIGKMPLGVTDGGHIIEAPGNGEVPVLEILSPSRLRAHDGPL